MELPRALWPWRQSLSIFPKDLATALGGVIDKLSLLIGPLVSPDTTGRNEPDGFEGIGRRGSFERLLVSEWALADEAPLEFLRRVSTGELSFLEIAHQKPTVARQCVALFDVGPDQRGGPRIVHLALLILLAQRAHDGGAQFSWGIVQDPTSELLSDVNEESVRHLLKPGNHRRMVIDDAIRFYQAFQDDEAEVWFIGGSSTSALTANIDACRVEIEDSLDPDAPYDLHVTVRGNRGKPRSVTLELPGVNVAVRLLRDPFYVARAIPQKSSVRAAKDTNFVLSRDFRKLFLRGAEGELITIPVPNSPSTVDLPKPRIFRPPAVEKLAAVGRLAGKRTIAVVTVNSSGAVVHELSPRLATSVRQKQYTRDRLIDPLLVPYYSPPWIEDPDKPTRLGALFQFGPNDPLLVHDGGMILYKFSDPTFQVSRLPAMYPAQEGNGLCLWQAHKKTPAWISLQPNTSNALELPSETQDIRNGLGGYLAVRTSPTTWHALDVNGKIVHTREVPLDHEVLGVIIHEQFLLYVLDSTRTRVFCIEGDKMELCFKLSSPIRTVHATPATWCIVFLTEDDELCIYSRDYKTFVLRMQLGET